MASIHNAFVVLSAHRLTFTDPQVYESIAAKREQYTHGHFIVLNLKQLHGSECWLRGSCISVDVLYLYVDLWFAKSAEPWHRFFG